MSSGEGLAAPTDAPPSGLTAGLGAAAAAPAGAAHNHLQDVQQASGGLGRAAKPTLQHQPAGTNREPHYKRLDTDRTIKQSMTADSILQPAHSCQRPSSALVCCEEHGLPALLCEEPPVHLALRPGARTTSLHYVSSLHPPQEVYHSRIGYSRTGSTTHLTRKPSATWHANIRRERLRKAAPAGQAAYILNATHISWM